MPTKSIIHESVISVLKQAGVKPKGSGISPSNHRGMLRESDQGAVMDTHTGAIVRMTSHPKLSDCSWDVKNVAEGMTQAFAACRKAGGFVLFESIKGSTLTCRYTLDATKASAKDQATLAKCVKEATSEKEDDETDGTGEASGDTKTNTGAKNDKGVGTKKGTKSDNKGDENSEECNEGKDDETKPYARPQPKSAAEAETKVQIFNKEKLAKYKDLVNKRKTLASSKSSDALEKKKVAAEMAEIDAALDVLSESFYGSLKHGVTFVLYEHGVAEVHGLSEAEVAPFGGTAPVVPVRFSKAAQGAGPNSKVDMGVLSLYKTENMDTQSAKILTGKDFKAMGWGTPGKGTGKQGKWADTGKHPMDNTKKLKAGTEG